MRTYEASYRRLRMLAPSLDASEQTAVAPAQGLPPLYLTVLDRFPYTTVLRLTHFFDDGHTIASLPDVYVRMYHDARLAEAASLREGPAPSPPYSKWERNRFLERWLGYCLRQGYRFSGTCRSPFNPRALTEFAS
jgi:uncharacterized protein YqiB (DUF1249 family)